jgi:hypothetical protein
MAANTELVRREVLAVGVAVWARSRPTPPDLTYNELRWEDEYRAAYTTVDQTCRLIKHWLAGAERWTLVTSINTLIKAHCSTLGDIVIAPLFYGSSGGPELYTSPQSEEGHFATMQPGWIGRRMTFGGLTRIQTLKV